VQDSTEGSEECENQGKLDNCLTSECPAQPAGWGGWKYCRLQAFKCNLYPSNS
jgi:hypothetical protein